VEKGRASGAVEVQARRAFKNGARRIQQQHLGDYFMDALVLLLAVSSYIVTFMLGAGMGSYLSSHRRSRFG
jgi:hypothetical protein